MNESDREEAQHVKRHLPQICRWIFLPPHYSYHMKVIFRMALSLLFLVPFAAAGSKPFAAWENCTFVPTEWADGDSFLIKKPDGETMTIRLYGADCMEWHITDDSDARRLRAQRRYFGITEAKPTARESIELAKGFGKSAAEKTASLLARPFTVHTRMQSALGDGRYQRYYAFVECADGTDLGTELVRSGLARAYGVYADGPDGRSRDHYRQTLADMELQAAKRGTGVWALTNWDKLPGERQAQRQEDEDNRISKGGGGLPDGFRLNPNLAGRDALMQLPGIGETLANRVIETRDEAPFMQADDLMRVPGIKQKTLTSIRPFLSFDKP